MHVHGLTHFDALCDTIQFYGVSEKVIGAALTSPRLASKFPRHSYHLITKCGRYGANKRSFDYSPERIRASVQESLERLNTTYLDAVYLHDVEFVAEEVGNSSAAGYPLNALESDNLAGYGLDEDSCAKLHGEGDRIILQAFETLLQLKSEGLIRKAGMAAYPLPTLLRLSRLIRHHLAPVDIVQSYSCYNLQNSCLASYVSAFSNASITDRISRLNVSAFVNPTGTSTT
jgi:D-arabinose 1-dehydrogenase